MPVALAEADDLVLDRGAIARPAALDLAGIHRRAMHIGADDLMGLRRRAGDGALDLRRFDPSVSMKTAPAGRRRAASQRAQSMVRPSSRGGVPVFRRPSSKPWRSNVIDSPSAGASPTLPAGISSRRYGSGRAEKCPSSARRRRREIRGHRPGGCRSPARSNQNIVRLALDHLEIGDFGDRRLHRRGIEFAVRLRPRSSDCRSLAAIQNPKLDAAAIGHPTHQAVQGIDLANQMTLAESSDRRIAGHRADGGELVGHQRCLAPMRAAPPRPHSRRGRRR